MSVNKSTKKGGGRLKEALGILGVLVAAFGIIYGILNIPSCEREEPPHKAEKVWAKVTDTETGITYIECPDGYGPTQVNPERVFMECTEGNSTFKFYEIRDTDTSRFIALKEVNGYTVYRAESVTAPSIRSFKTGTARLYMAGATVPIDYFYTKDAAGGDAELDGTAYINMVVDAFSGGGVSSATGDWGEKNNFSIWLTSKDFPGLYYKVEFKVDVNGAAYLYDRVTEKLVSAPKALVAKIVGPN